LSTPLAIFGALFGLLLRSLAFDVYAQIGLIMLVGLSAKNAILIVEFARARLDSEHAVKEPESRSEQRHVRDQIREAAVAGARLRLRPILMTSFAFILGMLPLWAAHGAGGAARRVLGSAVVSGLFLATLLGVFLIPALFVVVEGIVRRRRGPRSAAEQRS
jgi:HAE1 family hydrophobic/amphiphilic exporter-1